MSNSFNYVFIKDMHLQFGFQVGIRKRGWEKDVDNKLRQIIDYMRANNIKYLFTAGDIFDKSLRKQWSFSQFQANKKRLQWFEDAGISIYSNLGNHDYFEGHEVLEGTVFSEMVDLNLITYIGSEMEPIQFPVGKKGKILLFGIDYHQSETKILNELKDIDDYPKEQQSSKICLMHSNITSDNTRLTDFTYKQLSVNNIDVLCCGHYHLVPAGGAIQEINGTHFLNPWNLTRVSRDYHTKLDEHRPEFIHGTVTFNDDTDPIYEFKEIFLDVKKFSEAFNIDIINMLQDLGKNRFEFFDNVELKLDEDASDDEKLIHTIAEAHGITENSINIAKELL